MGKTVKKNYIYNLIYQLFAMIVPLITTPYISRVLGPNNVGIYSYTLSIVTYFILFGSLGLSMYGQREIAYNQDNKVKYSKTFYEVLLLKIITMSFSMLMFYFIFVFRENRYSTYYLILLLEMIATALDISWFFQGLEEFKKTVTRNMLVRIVSLICIFLFIKSSDDLVLYFLIYVFSNLFGNLSLWLYLPKYILKIDTKNLNLAKHLRQTIALFIPQIAIQIYTVLDKTMIGILTNDMNQVAFYEQSQKIIKIALTIVTALGTVKSPRISSYASKNDNYRIGLSINNSFRFVWFIGVPITFGLMGIAPKFVPWFFGSGYNDVILLMIIGSLLVMAIGINNVSGIQFLMATKRHNMFTISVVSAAIFNFILNLILIPVLGPVGAIISSVLAETLIIIIHYFITRKILKLCFIKLSDLKYVLFGFVMLLAVLGVGVNLDTSIISTVIQIIVGVVTYSLLLLIFGDENVKMLVDRIFVEVHKYVGKKNN